MFNIIGNYNRVTVPVLHYNGVLVDVFIYFCSLHIWGIYKVHRLPWQVMMLLRLLQSKKLGYGAEVMHSFTY